MSFVRNVSGSNSVLPKMYLSSVPWRVSLVMYYLVLFSLLYHPAYLFNYRKTEDVLSYKTTLLLLHLVLPLMASIRNVNKPPPPGVVKQRHVYGVLWRLIARDRVKLIPPPSNWGVVFSPISNLVFHLAGSNLTPADDNCLDGIPLDAIWTEISSCHLYGDDGELLGVQGFETV